MALTLTLSVPVSYFAFYEELRVSINTHSNVFFLFYFVHFNVSFFVFALKSRGNGKNDRREQSDRVKSLCQVGHD